MKTILVVEGRAMRSTRAPSSSSATFWIEATMSHTGNSSSQVTFFTKTKFLNMSIMIAINPSFLNVNLHFIDFEIGH